MRLASFYVCFYGGVFEPLPFLYAVSFVHFMCLRFIYMSFMVCAEFCVLRDCLKMYFVFIFLRACLSNLFCFSRVPGAVLEQGWGAGLEEKEKSISENGRERRLALL